MKICPSLINRLLPNTLVFALTLIGSPTARCQTTMADDIAKPPEATTLQDETIGGKPVQTVTRADIDNFIEHTWERNVDARFKDSAFDKTQIRAARFIITLNETDSIDCGDHAISIAGIASNADAGPNELKSEIWRLNVCGKKILYRVSPGAHGLTTEQL